MCSVVCGLTTYKWRCNISFVYWSTYVPAALTTVESTQPDNDVSLLVKGNLSTSSEKQLVNGKLPFQWKDNTLDK